MSTAIVTHRHRQQHNLDDHDNITDNLQLDHNHDETIAFTDELTSSVVFDDDNNQKVRKRKLLQQNQLGPQPQSSGWRVPDRKGGTGDSMNYVYAVFLAFTLVVYVCYEYSQLRLQQDNKRRMLALMKRGTDLWVQRFKKNVTNPPIHKKVIKTDSQRENDEEISVIKRFELYRKSLLNRDSDHDEMNSITRRMRSALNEWFDQQDYEITSNLHGGIRWIRPYLLPPHPDHIHDDAWQSEYTGENPHRHHRRGEEDKRGKNMRQDMQFFKVDRERKSHTAMKWEEEYEQLKRDGIIGQGPPFDYTNASIYKYPSLLMEPPNDSSYPPLQTLQNLMDNFPQDHDYPKEKLPIHEVLMHFDYTNSTELAAAELFRDAELPFKLINVPEVIAASNKWTDEYLSANFGSRSDGLRGFLEKQKLMGDHTLAKGTAQESPNSFFAFFVPQLWNVEMMGLPPVQNNDWSFETWSKHALYADAVSLSADQPHFYWQSGVDRNERYGNQADWTFISKDLPSFSAVTENFFLFHPEYQKGIQCRFGERGVVAATHYDSGRNMIAMMTGAKRYVLSPPNQCSKLGIFTSKRSPIGRHSLLNFGHLQYLTQNHIDGTEGMSKEERAWLETSAESFAVETILKKGEVLYVPSHWFHYIVSLQKSAQCNVRSGINLEGSSYFGGKDDVEQCTDRIQ